MKKLLLMLLVSLFLTSNVFASNYREHLNKDVEVCVVDNCYQGRVIDIIEATICVQREPLTGNCIQQENWYTMILRTKNKLVLIACERIESIRELEREVE